jgi:S-formylglutathione hydrolase FrmB
MSTDWTRHEIAGKMADVYEPVPAPRFAVLYLHPVGLETPIESVAFTQALTRHGFACCAPHGARSWWADRICPEFDSTVTAERHLLDAVVPWMQRRWSLKERAIAVLGISMGGQGAVRLGFKYPERFPVVGSIAGAFDYHDWYGQGTPIDEMYESRERCRQDSAILHLNPLKYPPHIWLACDPNDASWYRGNDRLHEKLNAYGIPHVADLETEAGGHTWEYFDHMAAPLFDFVAAGLEKESRRLM